MNVNCGECGRRYYCQTDPAECDSQATNMVDEMQIRHGHWIYHTDDLFPNDSTQECSYCHEEEYLTLINDNYCPNCGAKMDEVSE